MLTRWLYALNVVMMILNLCVYAWGTQSPGSLAVGILCGFAALGLQMRLEHGN